MIEYKEHDGQLFRMLDKPVPLTPNAEMPCLVRLIQDDSPMGKHNKELHAFDPGRLTPKICTEVIDVNDLSDPNRGSTICDGFMSIQYYRYELIGTFVKDGSKEWALYQMMQWKIVCHKISPSIMYCKRDSKIMREVRCGCVDFMSIDAWLNGADKNGWQIYEEPTPKPPREPEYVICKRCGGTGYEIKEQKPDNLYLNIKTSNPVNWCFDKKNLLVLVDDNFKGIVGENVTQEQVGDIAKLLTEQKPFPSFKVGDNARYPDP